MTRNLYGFVGFIFVCLISCSSGPVPIAFGEDECAECKMKISDHRFGAESITDKGKIRKYDSVECLVEYLSKNDNIAVEQIYVIDYLNPKTLIPAEGAGFLISKSIPSPMGGFISAYENMERALHQKNQADGQAFSWTNLKDYLN